MIHTAEEFLADYGYESATTAKLLGALTDASLTQQKADGHPTLGDIAWHIATTHGMMLNQCGFSVHANENWTMPAGTTAQQILDEYNTAVASTKAEAATKTPEDLQKVYNMWGMMDWPVAVSLAALIHHEVHHRGQLSVLMRQAGLTVPSIYGPNFEETQEWIAKKAAT